MLVTEREPRKNGRTNGGDVWVWTLGGPRNGVLGGARIHKGRGTFRGHIWACPDLSAVDILNLVR